MAEKEKLSLHKWQGIMGIENMKDLSLSFTLMHTGTHAERQRELINKLIKMSAYKMKRQNSLYRVQKYSNSDQSKNTIKKTTLFVMLPKKEQNKNTVKKINTKHAY